jgi:predicted peptidase
MGGFGTWSLAAAYPKRWAAIAPISGGGDPKTAGKIKEIPCWCFHGDADKTVSVEKSRTIIKAGGSACRRTAAVPDRKHARHAFCSARDFVIGLLL